MSDFDDSELRRQLRGLAGPPPDEGAALVAVRQRAGAIRRRRTMVWTAGSVVAVAALALLAIRPGSSPPERPAVSGVASTVGTSAPASTVPSGPSTGLTSTAASTSTVGSTVPGSTADGSTPSTSGSVAVPPAGAPPASTTPSAASTVPPSPTAPPPATIPPSPTDAPSSTDPPAPTSAPATSAPATSSPAAPVTSTYSGQGGSATVRLAGGQLSLVSQTPNAGFTTEIHDNGPDRVEVRFRSSDHETVVRVDLVGGQMVPRVDENGAG